MALQSISDLLDNDHDYLSWSSSSSTTESFFQAGNQGSLVNITDYNASSDRILFASTITQNDIAFHMNGQGLVIKYGNTDVATITNQNLTTDGIEKVELVNGTYLTATEINTVIQQMTPYAHGISLTSVDDVRRNQELMG
ncbi:MAG TPA: hypothetical protein DCZ04_05920 [Syntrophorhabdus aromaticivorans]|nr:hypothetical protein [Syntrophorhabdus aromaticivorans]